MTEKEELVIKARNGDNLAFQILIEDEQDALYRFAFIYVRNETDAIDIYQQTVCKALTSIHTLKEPAYFSSWLTRILINVAIAFLNKRNKTVLIEQTDLEKIEDPNQPKVEEQMDLLQVLGELDDKYKTVLLLRYYQDYQVKQIAEMLNCPEGTVKTNIRRGLKVLKNALKGAYVDD
ncbi:sigma-70 family RNA polymerase sigma factor [Peribacillus frigoritolerans]|uniref:sigma-70 family RNA polymerase sigma factor n=2 Tax=Peribacillus TaxID=2675229 RepID=UPI0024BFBCE5|nr:sigma-70 family RNA polymerase sigma factor [Peribacillus frigoritolerans]WHY13360.1 sigma-70 family RNA polymerase sigma factor [Peribacillus frigoritolerans]